MKTKSDYKFRICLLKCQQCKKECKHKRESIFLNQILVKEMEKKANKESKVSMMALKILC